jgi:uncharacterized protein
MVDLIRYDLLVQDAIRGVVRKVLGDVAAAGELPGEHHFTITFRTSAPGVKISRRLAEQWPQELTIILQHQFYDLAVDDHGFSVRLSFRGVSETLYVPFGAITAFSDPAAPFGFKFDEEEREGLASSQKLEPPTPVKSASAPTKLELAPSARRVEPEAAGAKSAGDKIVSIDAFRKKH